MNEEAAFWQAVLIIVGAVGAVATSGVGALAYVWKRDADRKLWEVRQQAEDARRQASQVSALTSAVARLADSWTASEERATEERKRFTEAVAASAAAERRLTRAVEANSEGLVATRAAVEALAHGLHEALGRMSLTPGPSPNSGRGESKQ